MSAVSDEGFHKVVVAVVALVDGRIQGTGDAEVRAHVLMAIS